MDTAASATSVGSTLEHRLRSIPGVVACGVESDVVTLLVSPSTDAGAVEIEAVRRVQQASAAVGVTVVGGFRVETVAVAPRSPGRIFAPLVGAVAGLTLVAAAASAGQSLIDRATDGRPGALGLGADAPTRVVTIERARTARGGSAAAATTGEPPVASLSDPLGFGRLTGASTGDDAIAGRAPSTSVLASTGKTVVLGIAAPTPVVAVDVAPAAPAVPAPAPAPALPTSASPKASPTTTIRTGTVSATGRTTTKPSGRTSSKPTTTSTKGSAGGGAKATSSPSAKGSGSQTATSPSTSTRRGRGR